MQRYYRLNQYIIAKEVRLIGEDGKQIGIVSKDDALAKAREQGVDLVEVASGANPPVCRLIEFKKFKYLEAKKERQSKKSSKDSETKEIRMGPFIGTHDFEVRLKRATEFLKNGDKIKALVKFAGREFGKKEFGYSVLNRLIDSLKDIAKVERPVHFEGRTLVVFLSPLKKKE